MRRSDFAAIAVCLSVLCFIGLLLAATAAYPGGTWQHRAGPGSFWSNFLCDLLRDPALNGLPNARGAALARAAMLVIAVGMGLVWLLLPTLFTERPRLGTAVRTAGLLAMGLLLAVPLLPSDRFGRWHAVAVNLAELSAFVAGGMGVAGTHGVLRWIGATALLVVALAGTLYAREAFFGGTPLAWLPGLQKIAALLVLGWMLGASLATLAPRCSPKPPAG